MLENPQSVSIYPHFPQYASNLASYHPDFQTPSYYSQERGMADTESKA